MGELLNEINSPKDLKKIAKNELEKLSREIRTFLIESLAETGGHLASNLGVVELTIALHYHLNSPEDKIIWDVGHQSYTHKILTGRKNQFSKLRQKDGLSGYLKQSESCHDIIEAGHTSTSISSALGLALARDHKHKDNKIYAVIGDGALTGGMAFEGLNHAGHLQKDLNVILNDNEMSIAANTGALSHYLSNIRTDPTINKLKDDLEFLINHIPKIGPTVTKTVERVKTGLKYLIIPGILFEEMGFTYLGPIDGHNIDELLDNFQKADRVNGPVIIHVNTSKGKGYKLAEENPKKYHGISPFEVSTGKTKKNKENITYSEVFGQTLVKLGKTDKKIVGITAAMPQGTCIGMFEERFPERTYDVGIAEQHAVTLGAGLARGGMKPVIAVYSTFLQRAFDQIIQDVCLQNLPVTLSIDRAGIVGRDGETHQGVFDISYLKMIPNMMIMAPKNENELQHMLYTAVNYKGPAALRYPRGEVKGVKLDSNLEEVPIGKAEIIKEGNEVVLLAVGSTVSRALRASDILATQGISAGVINARFVKPLDKEIIIKAAEKYNWIVTVEEHVLSGGFGSAVLELLTENNIQDIKVKRIGLPDEFIPQGESGKILAEYGLDARGISIAVKELVENDMEVTAWPRKNA
ncbi:MAG: 1-deoxy-D-xylulose-5-phosphate synthase [Bacillota bacterium]